MTQSLPPPSRMPPPGDALKPTESVAANVRAVRSRRGWSAQTLADRCAEIGVPSLDRSTVANIENGRRQRVGVDELFALAFALDVSPLSLLFPRRDDNLVEVVPGYVVAAPEARRWVRGQEQLPGRDKRTYITETPDVEFEDWAANLRAPMLDAAIEDMERLVAELLGPERYRAYLDERG